MASTEIGTGALRVEVLEVGATLRRVRWRGIDCCRFLDDLDAYPDPGRNPYLGSIAGRFANRIAGARFELDGAVHRLDANEGANHLHGGAGGFSFRTWRVAGSGPDHVELRLHSPDGDQGYPGAVDVRCRYAVAGDALTIDLRADTAAPTVVNLATHSYWNLSGGDSTIHDHVVAVAADHVLPVDAENLPIGAPAPVAGTRFDLRDPTPLDRICDSGGLDHCYVLADPPGFDGDLAIAAVLAHPASGRRLTVASDQPALQVYTATTFDPAFDAICLEPQGFPDAPNRPDFPSTVVRPGTPYRQRTRLRFAG